MGALRLGGGEPCGHLRRWQRLVCAYDGRHDQARPSSLRGALYRARPFEDSARLFAFLPFEEN